MVEQIQRSRRDIFGWPVVGSLFKNKVALFLVRAFVMILFLSAVYFGFSHPELQDNPYTTAIFWSLFWPFFMVISLVSIGPAFCGICPHGVMGRYLSEIGLKKKMPKWMQNRAIGFGILLLFYWLPVYLAPDLLRSPLVSASLFLFLTIIAAASYYFFKDMAYCTYLCPIGSVTKGYGKAGIVELRTYQDACSECKTFDCATACKSNLQPFLFEKKNSMRECTLCMDCAQACEAVAFNITSPGKTLTKKINDKTTAYTWVFILLLAVISVTMKLHHGLGHSPMKTSLPWYKAGVWLEQYLPSSIDWVGFSALFTSLGITLVLVLGGFYLGALITKVEFKRYLHTLSYALIPLMIVGALSHVGTFFFIEYASHLANAYYWLIGSTEKMHSLASFKDGWVHLFSLFNFIAIIWSEYLIYKRVSLLTPKFNVRITATLASSLIIYFLLFLAILPMIMRH